MRVTKVRQLVAMASCYHGQLGRFCSRDPIGYRAGSNIFEYVWDSPANRNDPSGLQAGPTFPGTPGWPAGGHIRVPAPIPAPSNGSSGANPIPTPTRTGGGALAGTWGLALVEPTPVGEVIAGGATIIVLAEAARRCFCKQRHPTWPRCEKPSNDEPAHAIPGLPQIEGMAGPYLTGACTVLGPAKEGPRCRGGGTRYNCPIAYFDHFGIVHKRTAGVFCCNCCHKIQNGIYCYLRTPPWAGGQEDPKPGD